MKYVSISDFEITHPDLQEIIETVKAWAQRRKTVPEASLVFLGPNGTGKTMLAIAILWLDALYIDGRPISYIGKFYDAGELVMLAQDNEIEDLIPVPTPPTNKGCPIVVIDDVGSEGQLKHTSATLQQPTIWATFTRIINHCQEYGISIVMTGSNNVATRQALRDYIGERAFDRLSALAPVENGYSYMPLFIDVPQYRKKMSGR